jgi:hypothetical protein
MLAAGAASCWLAAATISANAQMLRGEKFISVPKGEEIAIALNSVAHELNNHKCLTFGEQQQLLNDLEDLSRRVGEALALINDAVEHYPQGAPKNYDDELDRGQTRYQNFDHEIEQYAQDVRKMPICPGSGFGRVGLYGGIQLIKNWGEVRSIERLAATDVVTNQFSDRADPLGGGFLIGYKFAPWANSMIVSPFASFDLLHAPVNHTFPGGSYLGTTANFMGTFGVKAGPQVGAGVWLYGIAGVSVLNETLNINFIHVSSSQSAWAAGGTVGVGGAWQPGFLQGFGRPVSLFAEYQHTWWQDANFNTPTASPLFNYTFARQDDVIKFGLTIDLSPAAPPPSMSPRYVKAVPAK